MPSPQPDPLTWHAEPPAGWEPVAAACAAVFADLESMVASINEAIQTEIPEYGPSRTAFTPGDLASTTRRNVASFLRGIAEDRAPHPEELAFRERVGQVTARRGFPLQPMMASFLVAYRLLWAQLIHHADLIGGDAPKLLLHGGGTIWRWMHETTNALAVAYNKELADRDATGARVMVHLLAVLADDPGSEEARALAIELGFDPGRSFRVLTLSGTAGSVDTAREIGTEIQRCGGIAASAQRGRTAVVAVQGIDRRALSDVLSAAAPATPLGVGPDRAGITGLVPGLAESNAALELAVLRGTVTWFEDDWLPAIALAHGSSLDDLLATGTRVARAKPHLAEAVRAFADHGFSIAEGARTLRVSESSFRYRLSRWEALTGWSPTRYDGLSRSILALELAARPTD